MINAIVAGIPTIIRGNYDFVICKFGYKIRFYKPNWAHDSNPYIVIRYPTMSRMDNRIVRRKISISANEETQRVAENILRGISESKNGKEFTEFLANNCLNNYKTRYAKTDKYIGNRIRLDYGLRFNEKYGDFVIYEIPLSRLNNNLIAMPENLTKRYSYVINVILKYYLDYIELMPEEKYKSDSHNIYSRSGESIPVYVNYDKLHNLRKTSKDVKNEIDNIIRKKRREKERTHPSHYMNDIDYLIRMYIENKSTKSFECYSIGEADQFNIEAAKPKDSSDWQYSFYFGKDRSEIIKISSDMGVEHIKNRMALDYLDYWADKFFTPTWDLANIHEKTFAEIEQIALKKNII